MYCEQLRAQQARPAFIWKRNCIAMLHSITGINSHIPVTGGTGHLDLLHRKNEFHTLRGPMQQVLATRVEDIPTRKQCRYMYAKGEINLVLGRELSCIYMYEYEYVRMTVD